GSFRCSIVDVAYRSHRGRAVIARFGSRTGGGDTQRALEGVVVRSPASAPEPRPEGRQPRPLTPISHLFPSIRHFFRPIPSDTSLVRADPMLLCCVKWW